MHAMRPSRVLTVLLIVVLLFSAFVVGYFFGTAGESTGLSTVLGQPKTSSASTDFPLLNDVWGVLQKDYVSNIDKTNAVYGAIRGLVASLNDPYTVFFSPDESKGFQEEIQGTFEGVGAEIGIKDQHLVIIAPLPGSPAERAGLVAGDKILAIDQTASDSLTLDEAVQKIRGTKGTKVVLRIQKANATDAQDITIVRESITVQSVKTTYLDNHLADIEVSYFGPNTTQDFRTAVNDAVLKGSKGIILDLRNDPGGYLDAAIGVASEFVKKGTPIVAEQAGDGTKTTLRSEDGEALVGVPTVVLVDQGSASASEIVAGALQDLHAATIVGVTTFGKGSVQQLEDLPGGATLKVTVAKWLTPNGRSIQEHGITPDVVVERTADDYDHNRDPQLDKAKELLNNSPTQTGQ